MNWQKSFTRLLIPALLLLNGNSLFSQVTLTNGAAQASFPLFDYTDHNRLSLGINLNYTGGNGIPVDEMASNLGLGWDLSAGGVITRQQRGEPDDQTNVNAPGSYTVAEGYLYTPYSPSSPVDPILGWTLLVPPSTWGEVTLGPIATSDRQQDIFVFNFNGKSGSFVIGKNGVIKPLLDSKLRFSKVETDMTASNIVTRISQFTITDDDGIQYIFRALGTSRIYRYRNGGRYSVDPEFSMGGNHSFAQTAITLTDISIVSSWHLSEIVNPLSNKKIEFTYIDSPQEYVVNAQPTLIKSTVNGVTDNTIQESKQRYKGISKVLKNIQFPEDVNVDITYNSVSRADLPGANSLKKLAVRHGTTEQYAYEFTYKYFSHADLRDENYTFPAAELPFARLCLSSFRKTGRNGEAENPYVFTYARGSRPNNNENWIPARNSYSQDYWGYYNGNAEYPITGSTQFDIATAYFNNYARQMGLRTKLPNNDPGRFTGAFTLFPVAQNGALKSITTPNGGTLEYTYESNVAQGNGDFVVMGGVRVKSVSISDGMPGSQPVVTTYRYVLENGATSGWGYEDPVFNTTKSNILRTPAHSNGFSLGFTYVSLAGIPQMVMSAIPKTWTRVVTKNGISQSKQEVIAAKTHALDAALGIAVYLYSFFSYILADDVTTYFDINIQHPNGFAMSNPLPHLYSRVEEIKGTETENIGKTVYEFTSDKDYPLLIPVAQAPYSSSRPRYIPWAYGLPKKTLNFNKDNQLISETINQYKIYQETGSSDYSSLVVEPSTVLISENTYFNNNNNLIQLKKDLFNQIFGKAELQRTIQRIYARDGSYNEEKVEYEFVPGTQLLRKMITWNEKQEKIEKRLYYPGDYTSTQGALATLRTSFISGEPVSTETWLIKSAVDKRLLDINITEYQEVGNGDIKATKKYTLQTTSPVPASTIGEFNPAELIRNSTYIKEHTALIYNSQGNVIESYSNGRVSGMLYNDDGTAIIAKTEHASSDQIAYSSFEAGQLGNWNITGTPVFISDLSTPTGDRCLNTSSVTSIRKAGLQTGQKYRITYWSKTGSLSCNGSILENKTGRTENGWTIHYLTVTNVSEVILTGSGIVDELRLHPVSAVLQTLTYDFSGNIISETSGNDFTIKKEYDGLNRLKTVRDQQNNIIEAIQYINKAQ